jgi:hypothetical protein
VWLAVPTPIVPIPMIEGSLGAAKAGIIQKAQKQTATIVPR